MKTIKYGLEITFPDEDIADVNLIQRVLSEAPEFEDCLVNVYIDEPNNEKELTKIAKPCPSCAGREIHVFHAVNSRSKRYLNLFLFPKFRNYSSCSPSILFI